MKSGRLLQECCGFRSDGRTGNWWGHSCAFVRLWHKSRDGTEFECGIKLPNLKTGIHHDHVLHLTGNKEP